MAKPAPYTDIVAGLTAQWDLLLAAFAEADPGAPTGCAGWAVEDLNRHLGSVTAGLAALPTAPPATAVVDVAGWAGALPGLAATICEDARSGPTLARAVPAARQVLQDADPNRVVQQRTGAHRFGDAALFRLIESVVHGLDLPRPVQPDNRAAQVVVRALALVLSRQAPGRSVEVRIPPHAAVQCLAGPRHTRGTPPNVVEADPVAFVLLCTGRLGWAEAVRDGRVHASGERADLTALLPVLS